MKKKLLSVLMAGALVATSSVNAFASGTNTVTGKDTDVLQSDIEITGNIADTTGQVKPGTLSVTVPTAANFTVNENGEFIAGTIEISNGGEQEVDVHAYQFVDTNQAVGINVLKQSELAGKNRTHISLGIRGNYGTAYFKSAPGHDETGVYSDIECAVPGDSTGVKISRIASGQKDTLSLDAEVGKDTSEEVSVAKQDRFTLKLKITKSTNK